MKSRIQQKRRRIKRKGENKKKNAYKREEYNKEGEEC